MKRIGKWYKNTRLSARVIFSMNMAIFISILIISVFATINRINVQKTDARNLVENELDQITTLLSFLQDRPLSDLDNIIAPRILYNTGFISLITDDGEVVLCRNRAGQNVSSASYFLRMQNNRRGEFQYTDPVTQDVRYQYYNFYPPMDIYVVATLDRNEFINKPVYNTLRILFFAMVFTWITFSLANYFIMKTVTKPMYGLVNVLKQLGKGNLAETFDYPYKDEVGQMTQSVNELVEGLKRTAIFANEIGKNNFDHPFEPLGEDDVLGNALLDMRQSLKTANEEEKIRKVEDQKRSWTTQGLAKFADILRQNNDNINELSYDIIKNLVDYLEVNQGGVFVLQESESQDQQSWLELTACYAFDRRKYLEKKILPGEGLVGTCFLEQEPIYITQIPQDYIRITSGLGDENPSALFLIPLKINEKVYGVIELASFAPLEKHQLEFVEKIGESIASTISSVKINTQTAMLLEKSQQQAEEMRAQEEEMRQNMEELAATQESMAEKERDNLETIEKLTQEKEKSQMRFNRKEEDLSKVLDNCLESIVRVDEHKKIVFFNASAEKLWMHFRNDVLNQNIENLFPNKESRLIHEIITAPDSIDKAAVTKENFRILHKSGESVPVFYSYTITEAAEEGQQLFTFYFTEIIDGSPEGKSEPDPDTSHSGPKEETPLTENTDQKTEENQSESTTEKLDDLHKGDVSETQKAWSEHMQKKGRGFSKGGRKK